MKDSSQVLEELIANIKEEMAKVSAKELILFGSRANGTATPDSDYDFLILMENSISLEDKNALTFAIRNRLWNINKLVPLDIIVKERKQFEEESKFFGNLSYVIKEFGLSV